MVGVPGFEPGTSSSRTKRANRAALHPEEPQEYSDSGPQEANALCDRLEAAGIATRLDNEMLQGIVGEVPGG